MPGLAGSSLPQKFTHYAILLSHRSEAQWRTGKPKILIVPPVLQREGSGPDPVLLVAMSGHSPSVGCVRPAAKAPRHGALNNRSAEAGLQLSDMPECILQHISRSLPARQWARGPALTCRSLDRLPLLEIKALYKRIISYVSYCTRSGQQSRLKELFIWMGKRIEATRHLAIHIDCRKNPGGLPAEKLLGHLLDSDHLDAKLEVLDLTIDGWRPDKYSGSLMGLLQEWLIPSCSKLHTVSLPLDKAPSWLMSCPSLRHICLDLSPLEVDEESLCNFSGMQTMYLPVLQTLYLEGSHECIELDCIDFRDSKSLQVLSVRDCWIVDLFLPPSCEVWVSAQSCSLILKLDKSREHPLVSSASHVCLATDLAERVATDGDYLDTECYTDTGEYSSDEDWSDDKPCQGPYSSRNFLGRLFRKAKMRERKLRESAMGIPDTFPCMRSLRLTWPDRGLRPSVKSHDYRRCYIDYMDAREAQTTCGMSPFYMRCLSRQWQHVNLRELLIEGDSLDIAIPALPNLEALLVFCHRNVALHFTSPESLGRTIARMSIIGEQIYFHKRQELCTALKARELELVGDWYRCIAVHGSSTPAPTTTELLRQAMQGLACQCRACPSCLGIGNGC